MSRGTACLDRIWHTGTVPEDEAEAPVAVTVVVDDVTDDDLAWLEQQKVEKAALLDWLADH